jgi:hypothetical protein
LFKTTAQPGKEEGKIKKEEGVQESKKAEGRIKKEELGNG